MIGGSRRVKLHEREGAVIVVLSEEILDDGEDLRYALQSVVDGCTARIAIDMSGIRYVSARVLGVIADSVRRARANRGEVTVVCPDSRLRRFIEGMGFRHVVEIVASLSDALSSFSGGIVTPERLMLWNDSEVYAGA